MATVNTNDYNESLNYLKNSTILENNNTTIDSIINGLDIRVLASVESDLKGAKTVFSNAITEERNLSNKITTTVQKYIEVETKAKEKASSFASGVAVATGIVAAGAAMPILPAVATGVAAGAVVGKIVDNKDQIKDFFVGIGKGIVDTGAKIVDGVATVATNIFTGIGSLFKKAGNAVVSLGKQTVSFCKSVLNGAAAFIKSAANFAVRTIASAANLVMSLVEGVASFVEAIVDCAAMLGGVVCSLFTGAYDLGKWIGSKIMGTEFQSTTKAMWTKGIMPFVGTDYTGKAFDAIYETGLFKAIEDTAYGPFKREGGTIYSIGKGIGYTTGLIALTVATAGLGSSTIISSGAAGAGAMGKSAQKNYNKLSDEEKENLGSIAKVVGLSAASGIVEGAAWYLTFGGGKSKLVSKTPNAYMKGKTDLWNKGVDLVLNNKVTSKLPLGKARELLTASSSSMAKMGIQFKKTYVNAVIDAGATSSSVGEALDKALTKETFTNAVTNAAISLVYDNTFGKGGIVKKQQTAAKNSVAEKNNLAEIQKQLDELNKSATTFKQDNAMSELLDTIDDSLVDPSKIAAEQAAQQALLEQKKKAIQSIQDAWGDGISKTAGGFIKKLMDVRKYPDILNEFIGTEAA